MAKCLFGKRALPAGLSELPAAPQDHKDLKGLPDPASLLVLQDLPAHLELVAPQGAVDLRVHEGLRALAVRRDRLDLKALQVQMEPVAAQELLVSPEAQELAELQDPAELREPAESLEPQEPAARTEHRGHQELVALRALMDLKVPLDLM